ncbi:hypothetical protein GBA52_010333, partial [Prunus armeniaca]
MSEEDQDQQKDHAKMWLENPTQTKNLLHKAINQKECSIHEPLEGIGNRSFEPNGAEF